MIAAQRPEGRAARILLVDDAPDRVLLVSRILSEADHRVWTVGSGEAALERLDEVAPDLVLLDVVLPGMSGLATCRHIRSSRAGPRIRVVLFSGLAITSETQAEGIEAGADGYLTWPLSQRELLARVDLALRTTRTDPTVRPETPPDSPAPRPRTAIGVPILTPRQEEVVALVAAGRTSAEIAALLDIAPGTVETHRKAAMRRIGARSTAELVRYALLNGIAHV
ncbi:MAG: response regulator transcription factor [Gemmatimonadota bacterium]|nr:response regulator transcription factor [Gemmatimonadota bacterium]